MSCFETILWGLFGGFCAEAVGFFAIRRLNPNDFPYWVKSPAYYIIALVMVLIGGVITLAYFRSGIQMTAIMAIQIGATAPLIIRRFRDVVYEPPSPPDHSRID